mgnify:CR=1 FL=1
MAIASMLVSNIAMAAYADDVTVSEETVVGETGIEEDADAISADAEKEAADEEIGDATQAESDTEPGGKTNEETDSARYGNHSLT